MRCTDVKESPKITGSIKYYFFFILLFIVLTDLSVFMNVPILRQICGFLFLTFIPGLIIIYILKLNSLDLTEKIIFSVGLSISFVMFAGLLVNSIFPLFGYNTPLTSKSLLISFSIITIILSTVAYLRNRNSFSFSFYNLKLESIEKDYLLLPSIFPFLAIFGMYMMNSTGNNLMLMALLLLIPAYVIFMIVKHKKMPDKVYSPIIFLSSISLVLLLGLRSNHIIGVDIHTEYYLFQQTLYNGRWQIILHSDLDSCLSISILPAVYQSFLNVNPEYLFKMLYPLLFSFSPLVVYIMARKYLNRPNSFLAALFFMSQYYFLSAEGSPRTVIAILFFALTILVLARNGLKTFERYLLFIIFSISVIFSHYSTAYIMLFLLVFTWLAIQIVHRFTLSRRNQNPVLKTDSPNTINHLPAQGLRRTNTIIFSAMAFFFIVVYIWYSTISGAAFKSAVTFFATTLNSLQNFFYMGSRGPAAIALGSGMNPRDILQRLAFISSWITIVFIATGMLAILLQYSRTMAIDMKKENRVPEFLIQKIDLEFFILSLTGCMILASSVALPFVLQGYDMYRTFIQMAIFLSPFFVIGGISLAKAFRIFLHRNLAYPIILLALIPYFMFNTGTIYQVFNNPHSIILNNAGQDYDMLYVHNQESYAAKWIKNFGSSNSIVYSDYYGTDRLISQGQILSAIYARSFIEDAQSLGDGYFYLRYTGSVYGKLLDSNNEWHGLSQYQNQLTRKNLIYSNGGSEIYR